MLGSGAIAHTAIAAVPSEGAAPASTLLQGNSLVVGQEWPDHPRSSFVSGIQGPDVQAPSIQVRLFTKQELPSHPESAFGTGIQGPDVRVPVRDWIITRQELPFHPGSFFWTRERTTVPSLGQGIFVITKQEQPYQALWPKPPMETGYQTVTEFCFGYIIG